MKITIRHLDRTAPGELELVLSAWIKSYRDLNKNARKMAPKVFYPMQLKVCMRLLDRGSTWVAVADATILGFACVEGDVVHYVYVKKPYRGVGIASSLVGSRRLCSHRTDEALPKGWKYDRSHRE